MALPCPNHRVLLTTWRYRPDHQGWIRSVERLHSPAKSDGLTPFLAYAEAEGQGRAVADDRHVALVGNLAFHADGPVQALTSIRRVPSLSRSCEAPIVVVKTRAGLPDPSAIGGRTIGLSHTGCVFPLNEENLSRWRRWMRRIRRDQAIWVLASILGAVIASL